MATILSRIADSGAEAGWTASLDRGDGLPPFLLSINMVAGSCSAMRFEARAGGGGADCSQRSCKIPSKAFSSEARAGSLEENAKNAPAGLSESDDNTIPSQVFSTIDAGPLSWSQARDIRAALLVGEIRTYGPGH